MSDTSLPTGGAAMDRRVEQPGPRRWRLPAAIGGALIVALLIWRLIPSAGSTDMAAADIETGAVERKAFEDVLPVRATVAPAITTFITAVSGGQVARLITQDGSRVNAGQPLALLDNPTLKLDILTRESSIAGQLGTVSGDDLALEKSRLDRETQSASAGYDLIKARRDLSVQQQLHDQGFVSDAGVASYREQAVYQEKRLAQLTSGQASQNRIAALQAGVWPKRARAFRQSGRRGRQPWRPHPARAGGRAPHQFHHPARPDAQTRRSGRPGRQRGRMENGGRCR
jgi:HlyD family secretion protein